MPSLRVILHLEKSAWSTSHLLLWTPKPSASDFAEQQRRNDHRLPKSPSELMRRDPPNRMDLSPLSRPCFGCKLFPMKTIVFIFLLSLSTRAEEPVCKTVAECLYLQGRVESQ